MRTGKGDTNNLLERWRTSFQNDGRGEVMGLCVADNFVPVKGCAMVMGNGKVIEANLPETDSQYTTFDS
jgi:hypothetical protein